MTTCSSGSSVGWPDPSGLPVSISLGGTGTGVISLDTKTATGWSVSLVSGNLVPVPTTLSDQGLPPGLVAGDRIQVTARQDCQSSSGCKSYLVVRNAKDAALLAANFNHDPSNLAAFGNLLGVQFVLKPICASAPRSRCYEDEIQTQYQLQVDADVSVSIDRYTHAPLTIQGLPYTVWLGEAVTNAGGDRIPTACLDAAGFWAPGAAILTIVR